MPFRSIAEPEGLAKLTRAFDEAWAIVQQQQPVEPLSVAAETERLGHIIITLWRADPDCDLISTSVQQFRAGAVASAPLRDLERG